MSYPPGRLSRTPRTICPGVVDGELIAVAGARAVVESLLNYEISLGTSKRIIRRTLRSVMLHFCAMRRWLGKQKPLSFASSARAINTNFGDGGNGTVHAHVMTLRLIATAQRD